MERNLSTSERGFSEAAPHYTQARPDYPSEAIDFLIKEARLGTHSQILDLGAGPGHLTRHLMKSRAHLTASEPLAAMQAEFRKNYPHLPLLNSSAEAIDLPNGTQDAVFVGNAFHWFKTHEALREIRRVLKPYGQLFLVWNVPDHSFASIREFDSILEPLKPQKSFDHWRVEFENAALFGPLKTQRFFYDHLFTQEGLMNYIQSFSFIAHRARNEIQDTMAALSQYFKKYEISPPQGQSFIRFPMLSKIEWAMRV